MGRPTATLIGDVVFEAGAVGIQPSTDYTEP